MSYNDLLQQNQELLKQLQGKNDLIIKLREVLRFCSLNNIGTDYQQHTAYEAYHNNNFITYTNIHGEKLVDQAERQKKEWKELQERFDKWFNDNVITFQQGNTTISSIVLYEDKKLKYESDQSLEYTIERLKEMIFPSDISNWGDYQQKNNKKVC